MRYVASTMPLMKEATVLEISQNGRPREHKTDTFEFVSSLAPGDELWLMMGSTNAAVAAAAFRRGVDVRQISYVRAGGGGAERKRFTPQDVLELVTANPGAFYRTFPQDGEVLAVVSAWQDLVLAMEGRKAYANQVRALLQARGLLAGVSSASEVKEEIERRVGTKDPQDPGMQAFMAQEKEAMAVLEKAVKASEVYRSVFEPVEGVGPRIAARFMVAIERVDRFATAEDLLRYAGMAPTKDGKLPSRRRGAVLSRSPGLNNSCYMFQEQIFGYGRMSPYGVVLSEQIERECPCTPRSARPTRTCVCDTWAP